jgi:hypothetical protein
MARSSSKIRHEIESEIEDDRSSDLVWKVANYGCDRFSKWVIEGVFGLLFYNWSLRIEGQDL